MSGFSFCFLGAPTFRGARVASAIRPVRAGRFFQHRLSGVLELRKRVRLFLGGRFFVLKSSEELRSAERGDSPRPAAGKRVDTYGFYPLNSRFPLFPNPAQTRDRRPLRKGERQRILSTVGAHNVRPISLSLRSVRFRSATQAGSSTQARHNSVAQLVGRWLRTAPAGYNYQ